MFCPNCGRDCMDASFCPQCGQKLQDETGDLPFEERKKALQASGKIYCPSCLSTEYTENRKRRSYYFYRSAVASVLQLIRMFVNDAFEKEYGTNCVCLECGNTWFPKLEAIYARRRRYISDIMEDYDIFKYKGENGIHWELRDRSLTIYISEKKMFEIPLHKIAAVEYREDFGPLPGRLSIRDCARRNKPFPKSYEAAKKDKMTIFFDAAYRNYYSKLYLALKAITEENKKEGLF